MLRYLLFIILTAIVGGSGSAMAQFMTKASMGPGDVNGDCWVTLEDAILAAQAIWPKGGGEDVTVGGDANADGKIGTEEFVYVLQEVSDLREHGLECGVIGDSIGAATHTNDACGGGELMDCLEIKLGEGDPDWSFTGGSKSWAIVSRLGCESVYNAATPGDAIPQPPPTWSAEAPTPADLATPFGKLYTAVTTQVDPNVDTSVVAELDHAALLLGFRTIAKTP